MSWARLISALVSFASRVAEIIRDKQLMDAGAAKAVLQGKETEDAELSKAIDARAHANSVPDDQDPYNTDNK